MMGLPAPTTLSSLRRLELGAQHTPSFFFPRSSGRAASPGIRPLWPVSPCILAVKPPSLYLIIIDTFGPESRKSPWFSQNPITILAAFTLSTITNVSGRKSPLFRSIAQDVVARGTTSCRLRDTLPFIVRRLC